MSALGAAKFVDVDGVPTRYYDVGSGLPLVLVHGGHFGFLSSADEWALNASLATRYRLIAVDKLGMGHTGNPSQADDFLMSRSTEHLAKFLDVVDGWGGWLVGHSRGGLPVVRLALDAPGAVAGLVVVSSGTLFGLPQAESPYTRWEAEASRLPTDVERVSHEMRMNSCSDAHIGEQIIRSRLAIDVLPKTSVAKEVMAAGGMERFRRGMAHDRSDILLSIRHGRLSTPTLLVWGYDDPSARIDRAAVPALSTVMDHVPHSEMAIVNQAGHYVFREQPDFFDAAVDGFIQRH